MKKFLKAMLTLVLMVASFSVFACDDKVDPGDLNITSVTTKSFKDYYATTSVIDFAGTAIDVTYEDNTKVTLSKCEVDIDVADAKADTQFVLLTDGLSSQTNGYTVGSYDLKVKIVGVNDTFDLKTIRISDSENEIYDLSMFAEPKFLKTYKENLENAGKTKADLTDKDTYEASFMVKDEVYTIGDDNEFVFKPDVLLSPKLDGLSNSTDIELDVKVELIESGSQKTTVGDNYYTFNNDTYGFDFTDTAIGKTFTLTVKPKNFTKDENETNVTPIVMNVKVADGYNVTKALDLGRINLLDNPTATLSDNVARHYAQSVRHIFYVGEGQGYNQSGYNNINYYDLWKDFLKSKGESEESLKEIKGVYIHNNIDVTPADIPSEYFVGADPNEPGTDEFNTGTLRDFAFIYSAYTLEHNFELNGNLFNINFNTIPCGRSVANGDDSTLTLFHSADTELHSGGGHSTVFAFINKFDGTGQYKGTFKNVSALGNTSCQKTNDKKFKAQDMSNSLILLKSIFGVTEVDNTISKEFQMSMYLESESGQKTMDIKNSKMYDDFNSGVFSFQSSKTDENENTITNCQLERFGCAGIFLVSGTNSEDTAATAESSIKVDNDTFIENYVDGTEGWFTVMGANSIATQITGQLKTLVNTYEKEILNAENEFNLMVICLDNDYTWSSKKHTYNSIQFGDDARFDTADQTLNAYLLSSSYTAPTFMDQSGKTTFYNGTCLATGATPDTYCLPTTYQFTGSRLALLQGAQNTVIGAIIGLLDLAG